MVANKKPLTGPIADFEHMTSAANGGRMGYESSVGAGSPFVATVRRIVDTNDPISLIEGTFSGTLGYITAGLQEGKLLSELIKTAHALGYTEPDPRDDLSGTDVARKALILARTIGWNYEMSDVAIESFYPSTMADLSVEEFKDACVDLDAAMKARADAAHCEQHALCVVRHVRLHNSQRALPGRETRRENLWDAVMLITTREGPLLERRRLAVRAGRAQEEAQHEQRERDHVHGAARHFAC